MGRTYPVGTHVCCSATPSPVKDLGYSGFVGEGLDAFWSCFYRCVLFLLAFCDKKKHASHTPWIFAPAAQDCPHCPRGDALTDSNFPF